MTQGSSQTESPDPTEPIERLLRDLRADRSGLSTGEAARRLIQHGGNEITRRVSRTWPGQLVKQFTHPLALLLWAAAGLAWLANVTPIGIAIVAVIVLNAVFAFIQERQAERAVEALAAYIPAKANVMRDGRPGTIEARDLVPGDVIMIAEGDRVSADARLLEGAVEMDMSTLTGESMPVLRSATDTDPTLPLLEAGDVIFSGTSCAEGEATALVFATGMQTELGRIAALSERVTVEASPLEDQVRRVAWLIAAVAVGLGVAFIPLGMFGAGLSLADASVFAIGLLVGNVPEGLLPVITLALAAGVRELARRGAVVKRLSAVETLGSTTVICTDKTGTLTENRMSAHSLWTPSGQPYLELARAMTACSSARLDTDPPSGDPTEVAMLQAAADLGVQTDADLRDSSRVVRFSFNPQLKRMTTVDQVGGARQVSTKGAPEVILPLCSSVADTEGKDLPMTEAELGAIHAAVNESAVNGLRVLAVARRVLNDGEPTPDSRADAEQNLSFLGLVSLVDRPRKEVPAAVAACQRAGIRVIVITGDHSLTAKAVAKDVGIVGDDVQVLEGAKADAMTDAELSSYLDNPEPMIFSRSSPQTKLRIADLLSGEDNVVAMTGDGANDAPALRRADIGIAMGKSGTDVAREASTMVLIDDNFATIVEAIKAGRRVFDNVRKFVFYIFAHATPEVVPFLVFALGGGAIPLPLTVPQLLAVDIGTETLPALALGREPAEPGLMSRRPRKSTEGVIQGEMLLRAWLFVGLISAVLEMSGFFWVLLSNGWSPGDPTGEGSALHSVYLQATTMTFVGMVFCQVGTAFAARTDRASLRSIGVFRNKLLLWGIAFELVLTAVLVYVPAFQGLLGTAPLGVKELAFMAPFPLIVWGADETRRWFLRR